MNRGHNFEDLLSSILNGCDKDQLNKYLNDEEQADLLLKSMEDYQGLIREKENLQVSNKLLAEENMNLEPVLNNLKIELKECINEFERVKNEYISVKDTFDAQAMGNGDFSINSVYQSLQQNAIRAEEDSDKLADDFFCSFNVQHTEEELNSFQRQFLEQRTQAHIKKIKAEKLKELLPRSF